MKMMRTGGFQEKGTQYVLPKKSLDLLPNNIHTYLINNLSHLYPDDCELIWLCIEKIG